MKWLCRIFGHKWMSSCYRCYCRRCKAHDIKRCGLVR